MSNSAIHHRGLKKAWIDIAQYGQTDDFTITGDSLEILFEKWFVTH